MIINWEVSSSNSINTDILYSIVFFVYVYYMTNGLHFTKVYKKYSLNA